MSELEKFGLFELNEFEQRFEGSGVIYDLFFQIGRGVRDISDWASTQTLHHSGEGPRMK